MVDSTVMVATLLALLAGQEPTPIEKKPELLPVTTVETDGVRLRYAPLTWPPESAGTWPVGRLETDVRLRLDGHTLEPGHYALVCHAAHTDGASLEVVRLATSDWLDPMELRRLPHGEPLYRAPVRFDLAAGTAPRLTVSLTPSKRRITLAVHYGNSGFVKDLER